jgi:hypothetical protein
MGKPNICCTFFIVIMGALPAIHSSTAAPIEDVATLRKLESGDISDYILRAGDTAPMLSAEYVEFLFDINADQNLEAITYTIGIAHGWYALDEGQVFDANTAQVIVPFGINTGASAHPTRPLLDTPYQEVYLGFWLSDSSGPTPTGNDVYGWVRLAIIDRQEVRLLESAMDIGIITIGAPHYKFSNATPMLSRPSPQELRFPTLSSGIYLKQWTPSLMTPNGQTQKVYFGTGSMQTASTPFLATQGFYRITRTFPGPAN